MVMDYRNEVICKLNDIIKWKDEELIRVKQDMVTMNDVRYLDDNLKLKDDLREKSNQILKLLLQISMLQSGINLDHFQYSKHSAVHPDDHERGTFTNLKTKEPIHDHSKNMNRRDSHVDINDGKNDYMSDRKSSHKSKSHSLEQDPIQEGEFPHRYPPNHHYDHRKDVNNREKNFNQRGIEQVSGFDHDRHQQFSGGMYGQNSMYGQPNPMHGNFDYGGGPTDPRRNMYEHYDQKFYPKRYGDNKFFKLQSEI